MSKQRNKTKDLFDYDDVDHGSVHIHKPRSNLMKDGVYKRCYHSHPPLPLSDGLVIYGGSGLSPAIEDADIYVCLDGGFRPNYADYPWSEKPAPVEFLFKIVDMGVPKDLGQFKCLLQYLETELKKGKKVHVGCIGGHGRTGMVFSALVKQMMPEVESPTDYVRKHYCKKAVESAHQVQWLHQHFDIKKVKGAKEGGHSPFESKKKGAGKGLYSGTTGYSSGSVPTGSLSRSPSSSGPANAVSKAPTSKYKDESTITPLPGPESLWYRPKGLTPKVTKVK